MEPIHDLIVALEKLLEQARSANATAVATGSRPLSLAITHLEEACHWLREVDDGIPF